MGSPETFTSSTTWTCPAGVSSVQVECWGGGSSGEASHGNLNGGQGGGGGAYSKTNSVAVTSGTGYTVTVGGDTSFNVTSCVAKGGTIPTGGQASAGTGDVKYDGGNSYHPSLQSSGAGGGGGAGSTGNGGNCTSGPSGGLGTAEGGGNGGYGGSSEAGGAGAAYGGGGGGGGYDSVNFRNYGGGAGAGGKVILTYTVTNSIVQSIITYD